MFGIFNIKLIFMLDESNKSLYLSYEQLTNSQESANY